MIRQFEIRLSITFDRNMIWKSFWCQNVPWILNNMLNLKCQFWYLPQRASLAHVGSHLIGYVLSLFAASVIFDNTYFFFSFLLCGTFPGVLFSNNYLPYWTSRTRWNKFDSTLLWHKQFHAGGKKNKENNFKYQKNAEGKSDDLWLLVAGNC